MELLFFVWLFNVFPYRYIDKWKIMCIRCYNVPQARFIFVVLRVFFFLFCFISRFSSIVFDSARFITCRAQDN